MHFVLTTNIRIKRKYVSHNCEQIKPRVAKTALPVSGGRYFIEINGF